VNAAIRGIPAAREFPVDLPLLDPRRSQGLAPIDDAAAAKYSDANQRPPASCHRLVLPAQTRPETGSLTIHMILHAIGEEHYTITPSPAGLTLNTTFEYSDRGNKRTTTADSV